MLRVSSNIWKKRAIGRSKTSRRCWKAWGNGRSVRRRKTECRRWWRFCCAFQTRRERYNEPKYGDSKSLKTAPIGKLHHRVDVHAAVAAVFVRGRVRFWILCVCVDCDAERG